MAKKVSNPRFPHTVIISRTPEFDPMVDLEPGEPLIIYQGKCRSYQKEYVSTVGDVLSSKRVVAVPVPVTGWTPETLVKENDLVEVDYGSYKEYGKVVDKQPNNFGTDIYWEYGRN